MMSAASHVTCYNSGCGYAGTKNCSRCKSVFYCNEECQREDWKNHRPTCSKIKKKLDEKSRVEEELREAKKTILDSLPPATTLPYIEQKSLSYWAEGLAPEMQREWLVDCYRLRIHEDYICGHIVHWGSIYCEYNIPESMVLSFLVFCRLAYERGVLLEEWDWSAFLETAQNLLLHPFETKDAKEKYESERTYTPNRRFLRRTGMAIYGSNIGAGRGHLKKSELHLKLEDEILGHEGRRMTDEGRRMTDEMVANVGGKMPWQIFEMGFYNKEVGELYRKQWKANPNDMDKNVDGEFVRQLMNALE